MNYQQMSNPAILTEIGERLRRARLNANIGQDELAEKTGVSRKTIQNAESGKNCSLDTLISLLRGLNQLQQLDVFLPEPELSPMQLARLKGQVRQRASGSRGSEDDMHEGGWQW